MKPIELALTLEEINVILEALGQQPFVRVHQLIAKIQQQATAQLQDDRPTVEGSDSRGADL
jgi:hypothetical protein